jgi:hypothetical protein
MTKGDWSSGRSKKMIKVPADPDQEDQILEDLGEAKDCSRKLPSGSNHLV